MDSHLDVKLDSLSILRNPLIIYKKLFVVENNGDLNSILCVVDIGWEAKDANTTETEKQNVKSWRGKMHHIASLYEKFAKRIQGNSRIQYTK